MKGYTKGFTLIELLVVVAIIGLLSSIVLGNLRDAKTRADNAKYLASVAQYRKALEFYYDDNGAYPGNGSWGCIGVGRPSGYCYGSSYKESDTASVILQSAMNGYFPPDEIIGDKNAKYSGTYRKNGTTGYEIIYALEGTGANCTIGYSYFTGGTPYLNICRLTYP